MFQTEEKVFQDVKYPCLDSLVWYEYIGDPGTTIFMIFAGFGAKCAINTITLENGELREQIQPVQSLY
jgi:hypothetical protein